MIKFHSKVARVSEIGGGKIAVNFKEKVVDSEKQDPIVDTDTVELFEQPEAVEEAVEAFFAK